MQTRNQKKSRICQKPNSPNRLEFINDDRQKLAIPVGPRFQAEIPDWIGPPQSSYASAKSRWLGTQVWPMEGQSPDTEGCVIGKGRPDFCPCVSPGSIQCVKHHILGKRLQLQVDLGPAFWRWRFDEMGEDVSKLWNLEEQMKFMNLVKTNPISQGKSFLKQAPESLPSRSRKDVVSYFFNVYIPRRMSVQTRSGCKIVDTDDDEAVEAASPLRSSQKRYRAESISSCGSKYVKTRYLTGRR